MRFILTFVFTILISTGFAQDGLSRHSRTFSVHSGVPFQRIGTKNEWYNPDFEIGFDVSHSVRIKNRFYLSTGVGLNFSEYRSDPYVRTWTTVSFSPLSGSTVYYSSDDFERQTIGRFFNLNIPLQLEYMPLGKWKPYCRVGVLFSYEISYNAVDVYATTNKRIHDTYSYPSQDYLYSSEHLLIGIASGGIKYTKGDLDVMFGFTSQLGFYNFGNTADIERFLIGGEFCLRKTIPSVDFPHRRIQDSVSTKQVSKENLYVEIGGALFFGSFNYERALVINDNKRLNAKIGFGVVVNEGVSVPIGVNWTTGGRSQLEIGLDFIPSFSSFSDSYIAPHFGYRAEISKRVLMRCSLSSWLIPGEKRLLLAPGLSFGARI